MSLRAFAWGLCWYVESGVLFGPSALKFLLPNPKFRIAGTKTMKGVHDWPWGPEAADLTYLEMTASKTAPSRLIGCRVAVYNKKNW
ncbi:hypothetical protein IG631_17042 [Alternaria alternata]|nr:hypothetical protein IG631_17042 [Alternaria alternata]